MTDISESGIEAAVRFVRNGRTNTAITSIQDEAAQVRAIVTGAIQAYLPFHPPSREEGLRVKELAWEVEEPNWWVARSIVGGYEVRQTDSGKVRTRRVGEGWEYFDGTAEQAKSAMQEHYTNIVLSAITSPVQTREDGMREALTKILNIDLNITDDELLRIRNMFEHDDNVKIWVGMVQKLTDVIRSARASLISTKPGSKEPRFYVVSDPITKALGGSSTRWGVVDRTKLPLVGAWCHEAHQTEDSANRSAERQNEALREQS